MSGAIWILPPHTLHRLIALRPGSFPRLIQQAAAVTVVGQQETSPLQLAARSIEAGLGEPCPASGAHLEADASTMVCRNDPLDSDYLALCVGCLDWQAGQACEVAC
jgi:hypothetical protein